MTAVDIDDVRAAWREQRRAHERVVACFDAVTAAKGWDDENDALRALLGSLIILRATAAQTAGDLTGVELAHDILELPIEYLYPPIIDVDHEEVDPNSPT